MRALGKHSFVLNQSLNAIHNYTQEIPYSHEKHVLRKSSTKIHEVY